MRRLLILAVPALMFVGPAPAQTAGGIQDTSSIAAQAVAAQAAAAQANANAAALAAQIQALQNAIAGQGAKASAIPTSGPGAGLCRTTVVPSNLVTIGSTTGSAGTCSQIVQCGTSAAYVVQNMNVGGGC